MKKCSKKNCPVDGPQPVLDSFPPHQNQRSSGHPTHAREDSELEYIDSDHSTTEVKY